MAMDDENPHPRYFKEANSQFLLPGNYSMNGAPPGMVLVVVGMGLGYWWLIPLGIGLSVYLMKKVGEDELYLKSFLRHLLVYKGMRYIVASPVEPSPKFMVVSRKGETLRVAEWLERRMEVKERGNR